MALVTALQIERQRRSLLSQRFARTLFVRVLRLRCASLRMTFWVGERAAGHAAVAASVADHDGSAGVAAGGVAHVIEVPMALMMQIGLR
jgi:hypothetical protein